MSTFLDIHRAAFSAGRMKNHSGSFREKCRRTQSGGLGISRVLAPLAEVAKPYAEKAGLEIDWNDPTATTSKLAVITQTPREFDYPNPHWPAEFQYAGPFHDDEGRRKVPFPWEKLTGDPLVFASLGTLVNGLEYVYRIMPLGRGPDDSRDPRLCFPWVITSNLDDLGSIPSNTIVVSSAPQN